MKKKLSILFLIFLVPVLLTSWYTSAAAYDYSIDLTDHVSDVAVYSPGSFNDYGRFPADFGMTFSLVNPDGSSAGSSNYFYRPPDADYTGILPVCDESTQPGYSWSFMSSRTRISFADPVSAFSVDMGDKGEDVDTIHLALYAADGELISAIYEDIYEADSFFHTLGYNSGSSEIAYVDFWGVDSNEENTVYFNNVFFTSLSLISSFPTPTPLPGSLLLLGSGLVTCVFSRRKRRHGEL